ncbi:MAG: acyl carrier protein [Myxococcales bacterium]|nr:acyl carrier protein [Myxococcales bacterium]
MAIELGNSKLLPHEVQDDTLLVEDLGIDSFTFVELTARIEEVFELDEFPMQEWVDARIDAGKALTVGGLAEACESGVAGA